MKAVLHLKFIVLYIIFGFLCIFTTATLTTELITERLEKDTSQTLYREATMIADNYLPSYFSNESSSWAVHSQLSAMKTYLNSSLWFVEKDGTMITSANLKDTTAPQSITDFDPAEIGSNQYMIGTYHNYFREDMITVMAPVTQGFYTKGYLIIHSPVSLIDERCRTLMVPVYISLGVIFLLSFIFLLGFHFFVHRPLLLITEAAKQYAMGNLDYEIPVNRHDEIGYLSASLNYMATQLKDSDDYQKKIIANVSHDFRSPLTSIRGYVEAMADGTIPPELHEKYLNIILFETERLTDLTTDLLTLNEFDTKELLLNKTSFDIQEMIKHTAQSFEGAETAVLAHFDTVRVVALILHRVVIALLALRAGQRDLHAHTSSSHTRHLLLKKRTSSVRQTCLHIVHPAAMLVNRFLQVFLNTSGLLLFSPVFSVFLCFLIPTPEKIQIKQAPARRVEACMRHFVSASTPSAYRVCSSACAIIM